MKRALKTYFPSKYSKQYFDMAIHGSSPHSRKHSCSLTKVYSALTKGVMYTYMSMLGTHECSHVTLHEYTRHSRKLSCNLT